MQNTTTSKDKITKNDEEERIYEYTRTYTDTNTTVLLHYFKRVQKSSISTDIF